MVARGSGTDGEVGKAGVRRVQRELYGTLGAESRAQPVDEGLADVAEEAVLSAAFSKGEGALCITAVGEDERPNETGSRLRKVAREVLGKHPWELAVPREPSAALRRVRFAERVGRTNGLKRGSAVRPTLADAIFKGASWGRQVGELADVKNLPICKEARCRADVDVAVSAGTAALDLKAVPERIAAAAKSPRPTDKAIGLQEWREHLRERCEEVVSTHREFSNVIVAG